MKKLLLPFLLLVFLFPVGCRSFNGSKIPDAVVGVYALTYAGGTVEGEQISADDYEYYTVELKKDGTAITRSKKKGAQPSEIQEIFTYENGALSLAPSASASALARRMTLSDGVITYVAQTQGAGYTLMWTKTE